MFEDEEVEFANSRAGFTTKLRNSIQVGLLSIAIEKDGNETVGDSVDSIFNEVMKLFDGMVDNALEKMKGTDDE